jgi:DNA-binding CsgD family transcriptional regulator
MKPRRKLRTESLTPRQREVVELLVRGKTMEEAGCVLNLTKRTVAFHKYRIMRKLNLKSTADLVRFAIKSRILVS